MYTVVRLVSRMRPFSSRPFAVPAFMAALVLPAVLVSCVGASSRIQLKADGSGTLKLEYRIAQELENLGKLDGNEKWLPLPAGKADLERTAARIPGLKLLSSSVKTDGKDTIYLAELSFDSVKALAAFFDAPGRRFTVDLPGKRIRLDFDSVSEEIEPAFRELAEKSLSGYDFSFSMELPGTAAFAFFDREGKVLHNVPGTCTAGAQAVSYSAPMADLIFTDTPFTMEIRW